MVDEKELRKAQLKMVEILEAIDDICRRHDIDYWLAAGTLLGAVRHNGFIPWDDDCDIVMFRKDFEKFWHIAEKELPANMIRQNNELDSNYHKRVNKIRMKDTLLIEVDETGKEPYHHGIFVDVFILDYYPDSAKKIAELLKIVPALHKKKKQYPKASFKRLWLSMVSGFLYLFHGLLRSYWKHISKQHRKNEVLSLIGHEVNVFDNVFITKDFLYPVKYDITFEGKQFPVPNKYDEWLRLSYGDYMILPPVDKRHIHAKHIEC